MNTKYKIITSIMLIILANSILFICLAKSHFNTELDSFISAQVKSTRAVVTTIEQHSFQSYQSRIPAFVERISLEGNGATLNALEQRQRKRLGELTAPFYRILHKQNQYVHGLAFILPDNTNFLRVHKLNKFGDNVSKKRPDIVDANLNHHQNSGYSIAGINLIYTVVQPISRHGEHLGLLQIAIKGNQLLDTINKEMNISVGLLMSAEKSEFIEETEMESISSGPYSIHAFTIDFFREANSQIDWSLDQQKITLNDKTFIILKVFDLNNFEGQLQGQIIVGIDISQKVSDLNSSIIFVVLMCLIFLTLSFVISYKGYDTLSLLLTTKTLELQESTQRYKLAASTTSDLIYELDLQSKEIRWFGDVKNVLGYSMATKDELIAAIHPEDKGRVKIEYQKIMDESSDSLTMQYKIKHHDGTWRAWSEKGGFIKDKTGAPSLWIGACSDITEQRAAEKEKLRLVTAIHQTSETVVITDIKGTIQYVNPAFEKLTGYSPEEAIGQNPRILQSGKHDLSFYERMWKTLLQGDVWSGRITNKKKDNSLFEEEVTISPIKNNEGEISNFVAVKRDVSKELLLEKQLHRAQKMEAIGMMAGGVAHDLNNILAGIISYPELLLMQLPETSELREPIKAIQESGQRAATVVDDLLTVARGAATTKALHDLHILVNEYLHSPEYEKLCSLYPEIICIEKLKAEHSIISCSPIHIKKAVMNLVGNSMEAIDGKGMISISTCNQRVGTDEASTFDMQAGNYLILSVKDNGKGIPEKDLEHIFEPFYTKKVMGKSGTGLGLAIVWNSMQDHNGRVVVESNEQGTCFDLYFPIHETQDIVVEKEDEISIPPIDTNKYILVVDDEPQLRDIASKILNNIGYQVDSVCSGELAIKFIKDNPVDLVILDMLMEPGINGRQTYEEILKLYPRQKAIIASGFSESDDVKAALQLGVAGFIKKPYSVAQLGLAVKDALNG